MHAVFFRMEWPWKGREKAGLFSRSDSRWLQAQSKMGSSQAKLYYVPRVRGKGPILGSGCQLKTRSAGKMRTERHICKRPVVVMFKGILQSENELRYCESDFGKRLSAQDAERWQDALGEAHLQKAYRGPWFSNQAFLGS